MEHRTIDIKQYINIAEETNTEYQLFIDGTKTKSQVFEATTLRDAMRMGKIISRTENDIFKTNVRNTNSKLKLRFDGELAKFTHFVNFIEHDLILAFNIENRFAVLITKNGTRYRKAYTSKVAAKTTKATNNDYNGFIFNLDKVQKPLEDCSKYGVISTLSCAEKINNKLAEYNDYKSLREANYTKSDYLSTMTSEDRKSLMIALAEFAYGKDNAVKGFALAQAEANKETKENVIIKLNKTVSDIKRSIAQTKVKESQILNFEGSNLNQFKSKLPSNQDNPVIECKPIELKLDTVASNTVEIPQTLDIEPEEQIVEKCIAEIVSNGGYDSVIRRNFKNRNIYKLATAIFNVGSIGEQDYRMYLRQVENEYNKILQASFANIKRADDLPITA